MTKWLLQEYTRNCDTCSISANFKISTDEQLAATIRDGITELKHYAVEVPYLNIAALYFPKHKTAYIAIGNLHKSRGDGGMCRFQKETSSPPRLSI